MADWQSLASIANGQCLSIVTSGRVAFLRKRLKCDYMAFQSYILPMNISSI
jgi:hypothetical protein